ncbi:MAG TPA: hypothetical protein VL990_15985 [Acidobacteriaceae bacterium]|nr:hypothetical protein [Acidobacteriaceae bacterium]
MKFVRGFSVLMLIFLSTSAVCGGIGLTVEARGNPWGFMPLSLLQHSPLHTWLIPGIVLLAANGALALWVLWLVVAHRRYDGLWAILQGCILLGWLTVECVILRFVIWPHYMYGAVGVALIVAGAALRHDTQPAVMAR